MNMIRAIFALLLIFASGTSLLSLIKKSVRFPWDLPECWALGLGSIYFLLLLLSGLSIDFNFKSLFLSITVIVLANFRPRLVFTRITSRLSKFWLVIFIVFFSLIAIKTFGRPIWGYDAYESWLAKARAFYIDKKISQQNIYAFWPHDNWLLWPLNAAFVYTIVGQDSELWVKIIPLTTYVLLLFALGREIKLTFPKTWGIWVLGLATTPLLLDQVIGSLSGNADLLLTFFLFLGLIKLEKGNYTLAAFLLGLAAVTKNDALPAAIISLIMALIHSSNKIKTFSFASLPLVSQIILRRLFHLTSRYINIANRPYFHYLIYALHAYREQFRAYYNWHIIWWIVIVLFFITLKYWSKYWKTYLIIIIQLIAYTAIFITTPEPSPEGHIASALFRLLLHVLPPLYLTTLRQTKLALLRRG